MNNFKIKLNIKNLLIAMIVILSLMLLLFYSESTLENMSLIGITVILFFLLLQESKKVMTKKVVLLICVNFLSIIATLIFFSGLGSGLLIFNIVLAIILFNNMVIDKKVYILMHATYAIASLLFVLQFDLSTIASGYVWGNELKVNANSIGIVGLSALFHMYCITRYIRKNVIRKMTYGLITICFTYLIVLSNSRSSLLALLFYFVVLLFCRKEFSYYKYRKWVIALLILSLIFPLTYIVLYEQIGTGTFLGKNLFSGRQYIWKDAFDYIRRYPVLGSGTEFGYSVGGNTLTDISHNMMLGIWKSFGIVPTITIIMMMFNNSILKHKNVVFSRDRITQLVFLSSLVVGVGESFLTDCHFCFLFLTFLLMNVKAEEV